jgi:hypothetical protein
MSLGNLSTDLLAKIGSFLPSGRTSLSQRIWLGLYAGSGGRPGGILLGGILFTLAVLAFLTAWDLPPLPPPSPPPF